MLNFESAFLKLLKFDSYQIFKIDTEHNNLGTEPIKFNLTL